MFQNGFFKCVSFLKHTLISQKNHLVIYRVFESYLMVCILCYARNLLIEIWICCKNTGCEINRYIYIYKKRNGSGFHIIIKSSRNKKNYLHISTMNCWVDLVHLDGPQTVWDQDINDFMIVCMHHSILMRILRNYRINAMTREQTQMHATFEYL